MNKFVFEMGSGQKPDWRTAARQQLTDDYNNQDRQPQQHYPVFWIIFPLVVHKANRSKSATFPNLGRTSSFNSDFSNR